MYRNVGGPFAPDFIQFPVFRPHKQAFNARFQRKEDESGPAALLFLTLFLSIELSSRGGKGWTSLCGAT